MSEIKILTGNSAIAEAIRQVGPDVIAAYPITPSTSIVETLAKFVADGLINAEMVLPESEHSAMSACVGAAAAGGRVVTATASQGLALMYEILYIASALRLPIVAGVANRALSAPINIHGDQSDTMGARDVGWIQIYSENNQEAYDNIIQAFRIGEHPDVLTPVMVTIDGFVLTHSIEPVKVLPDEEVKKFVGEYKPAYSLLNTEKPFMVGPIDFTDYYFEHKRHQIEGINHAIDVIKEVGKEFGDKFGRHYGLFEEYKLEDAEVAIVILGSSAGTAKDVVDKLREEGKKVGLLRIRVFRPFPYKEIAETLKHLKVVGAFDRMISPGAQGSPVYTELRSALYDYSEKPKIIEFIYGLGGRDITPHHFEEVYRKLLDVAQGKEGVVEKVNYINLRE